MESQVGFLYPPHPDSRMKIRPESVGRLEEQGGWIAQRKYNGTAVVMHIMRLPTGEYTDLLIWNRHAEFLTLYKTQPEMIRCVVNGLDIPAGCEVLLNGELLHTKAKSKVTGSQAQTDTIVFYDLLYYNRLLLTETFPERYSILNRLCRSPDKLEPKKRDLLVHEYGGSELWLCQNFPDQFIDRFYDFYEFKEGLDLYPEIEGLVCKKTGPASRLRLGNVPYDVDWMMRVRKTKEKIYLF
jgi:hypothetical protein